MLYELPVDLGMTVSENYEISGKFQNFIELLASAYSSSQNENFVSANSRKTPEK